MHKDGVLLKPDRPAVALDVVFSEKMAVAEITATFTTVTVQGSAFHTHYVFAAAVPDAISLTGADISVAGALVVQSPYVVYEWRSKSLTMFDGAQPLALPPNPDKRDWQLHVMAPVLEGGVAFLGEPNKFVTASTKRDFVITNPATMAGTGAGVVGEAVELCAVHVASMKMSCDTVKVGSDGSFAFSLLG